MASVRTPEGATRTGTGARRFGGGFAAPEALLAVWGFGLNLVWEAAQTPLYSDSGRDLAYLTWTRLHCTLGDVLILLGAFWLTSLLFRSRRWIAAWRLPAVVVFVATGLLYTGFSEWLNVSVRSSWGYRDAMPTLLGIGLSPLLQWLVVPPVILLLVRRQRRARGAGS